MWTGVERGGRGRCPRADERRRLSSRGWSRGDRQYRRTREAGLSGRRSRYRRRGRQRYGAGNGGRRAARCPGTDDDSTICRPGSCRDVCVRAWPAAARRRRLGRARFGQNNAGDRACAAGAAQRLRANRGTLHRLDVRRAVARQERVRRRRRREPQIVPARACVDAIAGAARALRRRR